MTSVAERYARATVARDLTLKSEYQTDADVLLAAGVASGDARLSLGLDIYRLMHSQGRAAGELHTVATALEVILIDHLDHRQRKPMRALARQSLVMDTLHWWLRPVCDYCGGHGQAPSDTAPTLSAEVCPACKGTGRRPLHRAVPPAHERLAQLLVDELDRHMLRIQSEMAKRLAPSLDL